MNKKLLNAIVSSSITYENADEKGYEYIQDIVNPFESLNEILKLASDKGYKFGSPCNTKNKNLYYGLYRIKNNVE